MAACFSFEVSINSAKYLVQTVCEYEWSLQEMRWLQLDKTHPEEQCKLYSLRGGSAGSMLDNANEENHSLLWNVQEHMAQCKQELAQFSYEPTAHRPAQPLAIIAVKLSSNFHMLP